MPALNTVADYILEARTLLMDTRPTLQRYSDTDIVGALNIALQEAYRIRPELFMKIVSFDVPMYAAGTPSAVVDVEMGYKQTMIYYMIGRLQLRDSEDTTDQRAGALMQKFVGQLMSLAS